MARLLGWGHGKFVNIFYETIYSYMFDTKERSCNSCKLLGRKLADVSYLGKDNWNDDLQIMQSVCERHSAV